MTIYDDYIAYHDEYTAKYGPKTIIFLQVGDFFELYGVHNESEHLGPDMYSIGDICGLVITRKNKSIPENSRSNPLMAGFPLHAFQKQAQTLVQLNYTVVIIRQVTPPPNVQRKVTEIISPSTYITNQSVSASSSSYLITFLWEGNHVGMAGVDLTTGHTWVYEVATNKTDAIEECYRILQIYTPKEIILCGNVSPLQQKQVEEVIVSQHPCVHVQWSTKVNYPIVVQNKVLQKSFPNDSTGLLTPIEQLDLERLDLARLSLVHVLQFAYQHNDRIIEYLQKPEIILLEKCLTLEYNSAIQLNLVSHHSHEKPLLDILNRTNTTLGNRLFREWLLQPLTLPDAINARYDHIAYYMQDRKYDIMSSYLRKVVDLERAIRRMILKTFSPMDWISVATSLDAALFVLPKDLQPTLERVKSGYKSLNLDECAKYNLAEIKTNIFQEGYHTDLDSYMQIIREQLNFFDSCVNEIGKDLCRLECNERDGYYLCITKKRWETYRTTNAGKQLPVNEVVAKPISSVSSVVRLHHSKLDTASQCIIENQNRLSNLAQQYYQEFLKTFILNYQTPLLQIAQTLAEIDVFCTCAKNATEYNYCRPIIAKDSSNHSWYNVKALRHPIIERLQSQVAYVSNDISMGANGLLLYGVNSSGKSSFMKAIGLNIIMAQAGMYAAASEFTYQPYRHIFTRIASTDNLYRGMSSFVVEMTELRTILYRANQHSLVLGDELCAGTESTSALSIVAAGVDALVQKRSTFVFATHLHELTDYIDTTNDAITVAHMHIEIEGDKIIYERKLQKGKGNPLYGLEVCSALGMPADFLSKAQFYRRKITNVPTDLVSTKTSRYNAQVLMNECGICGKPSTETHHIHHQEHATETGFVESGVHLHHPSNLIPLCEDCHQKQHHSLVKVTGYVQTSQGPQVQISSGSNTPNEKVSVPVTFKSLDEIIKMVAFFPVIGWKKKTVKGVWRATTWEKVQTELQKNGILDLVQEDAQQQLCITS